MTSLLSEKNSLTSILKEKDLMVDSQIRQIQQLKEDLRVRDQEVELVQRRQYDEDKERAMMDRKEKSKLQKEMEVLEKNFVDLE